MVCQCHAHATSTLQMFIDSYSKIVNYYCCLHLSQTSFDQMFIEDRRHPKQPLNQVTSLTLRV